MNILQRSYDLVENYIIGRASSNKILVEAADRRDTNGALSDVVERTSVSMQVQTLDTWKRGISAATDPENPDWSMLFNLHENLMLDDHLESVIDSRIAFTQRRPLKFVNDKGDQNPDLKELFMRPWYEDMVGITLGSRFKGRRLLELFELNADKELDTVTEIQQPWFNAKKGLILKNPGDTTGWNYREGIYSNFYVQVGKNYDLGMLTRMAPTVLAKKLGMGAWLDYIDKYGVPPLFITTDREDRKRLEQLWNAASKFKSNNFMVGRGNEKFEIPTISGAGVAPFDQICTRADNMMSKRVLGGTGLTDEKGFVGSVEIQYKLALDRFESDGLLFKYFFNTQIRPRLVKLSPVYAQLANYRLEYDNTENLTLKEKIDLVIKLGALYDIDPKYIAELCGVPIIGKRDLIGSTGEGPEKK